MATCKSRKSEIEYRYHIWKNLCGGYNYYLYYIPTDPYNRRGLHHIMIKEEFTSEYSTLDEIRRIKLEKLKLLNDESDLQ